MLKLLEDLALGLYSTWNNGLIMNRGHLHGACLLYFRLLDWLLHGGQGSLNHWACAVYFSKAKSRVSKCAFLFKMKKRKPFECEENKVMRIEHKRIASRCANSFTGTTSFSPFYTPGRGGAEVLGSASGILRES